MRELHYQANKYRLAVVAQPGICIRAKLGVHSFKVEAG
jgi:hypothetical protein